MWGEGEHTLQTKREVIVAGRGWKVVAGKRKGPLVFSFLSLTSALFANKYHIRLGVCVSSKMVEAGGG